VRIGNNKAQRFLCRIDSPARSADKHKTKWRRKNKQQQGPRDSSAAVIRLQIQLTNKENKMAAVSKQRMSSS
jgi:hypothetical protein